MRALQHDANLEAATLFSMKIVLTLLISFSAHANMIFDEQFGRYLDGPIKGFDDRLYFSNGRKVMVMSSSKRPKVFHQLSNSSRLSGMTLSKTGDIYIADYRSHKIWKIPFVEGEYNPSKIKVIYQNKKMKQPNDIAILPNGDLVAVDHPTREKGTGRILRHGGVWFIKKGSEKRIFYKMPGILGSVAVSRDGNQLVIASGRKCYISSYKIASDREAGYKLTPLWTQECDKRWSVDGMEFAGEHIAISRISHGRIDFFDKRTGDRKYGFCLLKRRQGESCLPAKNYEPGKFPTGLTFIDSNKVALTFLGASSSGPREKRGSIGIFDLK